MTIETQIETPLAEAVRAAGGQSAFGRIIGRRQSTVRDWLVLQKPLPAEHVLTVERELGISRHKLRPDIYPLENVDNSTHQPSGIAPNGTPVNAAEALAA